MTRYIFFGVFMVFIVFMLAMDLGVFHKKDHVIKMKEAAIWTCIWIALSMVLAIIIRFHAEWIHGIGNLNELLAYAKGTTLAPMLDASLGYDANLDIYRKEMSRQYLAGYFLEESLSIDNIFVMIMIFVSFGIDKKYYHRVLFWGILGAIVLRFVFIFALGALVQKFSWVLAIFGVMLLYSGFKMFKKDDDEVMDTSTHPVVKFCKKHFRATDKIDGHNFFVKEGGKNVMTPLFIVLLVIEFSDIIFAVDSIPAVFSVTTDTYIVYFSNIFAIMGLRSLFFLLSDIKDRFWLLQYGLGVLLMFIGVKMLLGEFTDIHVGTTTSLLVILGILVVSIVLSMCIPKREKETA